MCPKKSQPSDRSEQQSSGLLGNTHHSYSTLKTCTISLNQVRNHHGDLFRRNEAQNQYDDDILKNYKQTFFDRKANISVNLLQTDSKPTLINDDDSDQYDLDQVAIVELASEQQTFSNFSSSPHSSSSLFSSHHHQCDFFSIPFLFSFKLPSSCLLTRLFTSSALSISSIFEFLLSLNHPKPPPPSLPSPINRTRSQSNRNVHHSSSSSLISSSSSLISSLRQVLLLCLLIFIISIACVQAMSIGTAIFSDCLFHVLFFLSFLLYPFLFKHRRFSNILLLISAVFIMTTVKVDALGSSQMNQHSIHDVHSMSLKSESTKKSDSIHPNIASSSSDTSISDAELEMLKLLGFTSRPNPSRSHKVPQYLLDLYFWFRQTQLTSNRERERVREIAEEQSKEMPNLRSPITALTSSDLDDAHRYQEHVLADLLADEEEARFVKMIHKHHRLNEKRQPSQAPRVTLTGPVNSVLSHKLKDHDDHTINRRDIPIRQKRDTASSIKQMQEQFLIKPATNEAHLTFDLHVPPGEHLKGGELRLYRYAVEIKSETNTNNQTSKSNEQNKATLTSNSTVSQSFNHNFMYFPLHWSLRWKSEKNRILPFTTTSEQITPNISEKNIKIKSDQFGSRDETFLQRINIYHLLRPITELHIIRAEHHSKINGNNSVHVNLGRIMRLIDTQVIDIRQSGWLSFDIYPAASFWTAHPKQNFGLLVTLTDVQAMPSQHSRLIVVNKREFSSASSVQSSQQNPNLTDEKQDGEHDDWNILQPHVVTFSANEKHFDDHTNQFGKADYDSNRLKRSWNSYPSGPMSDSRGRSSGQRSKTTRKRKKQRRACTRQSLFFDFNSVGWNEFVVAPPGFQTYFCAGSCEWPLTTRHNYTNHATIQGILNSHNPQKIPPPCCVPTDLTPYTLLTVDNNGGIHLRTFADMVVEGCGCR